MLFYRLLLTRFLSMLTFLAVAACSANAAQPSPSEILNPNTATDPLATFWLPTPTTAGLHLPPPSVQRRERSPAHPRPTMTRPSRP